MVRNPNCVSAVRDSRICIRRIHQTLQHQIAIPSRTNSVEIIPIGATINDVTYQLCAFAHLISREISFERFETRLPMFQSRQRPERAFSHAPQGCGVHLGWHCQTCRKLAFATTADGNIYCNNQRFDTRRFAAFQQVIQHIGFFRAIDLHPRIGASKLRHLFRGFIGDHAQPVGDVFGARHVRQS